MYIKKPQKTKFIVLVLFVFMMLANVHIGCQERVSSHNMNTVLAHFEPLCSDVSLIEYTKWFGCGTSNLAMLIAIYTF